jgi:AcrR family transcriptional regulator
MQEFQHRKGSHTRDRLLDAAEAAILEKGFAATSIDELIAAVGITKNGFFYHFKDKSELAKALLVRYVEREDTLFNDLFRRADELDEDPLHLVQGRVTSLPTHPIRKLFNAGVIVTVNTDDVLVFGQGVSEGS